MSCTKHDIARDRFMLVGGFATQGYDWWWHSLTGRSATTGQERSFFIEYFCCNPGLAQAQPVFGQLPKNQAAGIKPSYVMVKAGTWGEEGKQLHRFFAWPEVEVGGGVPFYLVADNCVACETDLVGRVSVSAADAAAHPEWMCDAGEMTWDLHVDKQLAFNVGFGASTPLRNAQAFEMFWHAEGIKTRYRGTIVFDGEVYVVDPNTCWGYADKNWGSDFTSPWVWLSSCDLMSERTGKRLLHSAFEIGGGRPKIGPVALDRKLLGCFSYEGEGFEFNFSKAWTGSQTEFDCRETEADIVWNVRQETHEAVMETHITCPKREMLLVNYEAPNGTKRHNRLWNGGTGKGAVKLSRKTRRGLLLVDTVHAEHVGCEYGEYDR